MTRTLLSVIAFTAALAATDADAAVVYNSNYSPIPINTANLAYEDSATSEFGDAVILSGNNLKLTGATVVLSSTAQASQYPTDGTQAGYVIPLTLSFYSWASLGPNPTVGPAIVSQTVDALIPWRPAANTTACTNGDFLGSDGACYDGIAVPVTFSFNAVSVPNDVIFGLSFNTEDYGQTPTGQPGPYNTLGFGLSTGNTVGTDVNPDGVEWNTADAIYRSIGPAGIFGPDTGWAGTVPSITIDATSPPAAVLEPGTLPLLLSTSIGLLAISYRRRSARPLAPEPADTV